MDATANPDIITQIRSITACRRCACRSCQSGYENHAHQCTEGPHCVETQEKLRAREFPWAIIAGRADQAIRDLRAENDALRARIAQLDGIHHG